MEEYDEGGEASSKFKLLNATIESSNFYVHLCTGRITYNCC